MIIINFTGQLGNQMFQYALGRKLELRGKKVKYSKKCYRDNPQIYFGLERFGLKIREASDTQVQSLCDERHRLVDRIRRKIFGRRPKIISEVEKEEFVYDEDVFKYNSVFIDGYWQSEKYFIDIRDILLNDFSFPKTEDTRNIELATKMKENMSVSVHVRRGDYLGGFPVMDNMYFEPAMNYFREKYSNVHFYIFSNDMVWCMNNFNESDITFVDWNTGKNSIFDMWLMTQCKHNIIANSTFSWWGAWLNTHDNKEVIAPKLWFYNIKHQDVYAKGWITI